MSMVNVTIVGNLTKAPQLQTFQSGKVKATLFVAVNYPSKADSSIQDVEYYRIDLWDRTAENAVKYLQKGNQIFAAGRFVLDRWIDQSGKERTTPVITASQITFPNRGSSNHANQYRRPEITQVAAPQAAAVVLTPAPAHLQIAEETEPLAEATTTITSYADYEQSFIEDAEADSLLAGARTVGVVAEPRAHYTPRTRRLARRH